MSLSAHIVTAAVTTIATLGALATIAGVFLPGVMRRRDEIRRALLAVAIDQAVAPVVTSLTEFRSRLDKELGGNSGGLRQTVNDGLKATQDLAITVAKIDGQLTQHLADRGNS